MAVAKSNLILIGMPGVGKSTIGVLLAKRLGVAFLDTDILMQIGETRSLQEIISVHGVDGFRRIEAGYLCQVKPDCGVVATGGSAVYSAAGMRHLAALGTVVYLHLSLAALCERLDDLDARGVLRMPGQTMGMLYAERRPLYEKYADITVATEGLTPDQVVTAVLKQIDAVDPG